MSSPIPNSLSVFHCDPVPITEFDDSDFVEESNGKVSSLTPSRLKVKGQHVPIIRQSVVIGALLEQLCSLYENDEAKSQKLYYILCDQLSKLGIISPVAHLKEFTSVRTQYKQTLYDIIQSSIMSLDTNPAISTTQDIRAVLLPKDQEAECKPIIIDPEKVFDFDASRYHQEFIEKGRVGSGGYGSVYRAHSKIDGQDYAVKKITLQDSSVGEKNEILLREVRILAGLRHKNIVRYHNAWVEHVVEKMSESTPNFSKSEDSSFCSGDFVAFSNRALTLNDSSLLKTSGDDSNSYTDFMSQPFNLHRNNGLNSNESIKRPKSSKFWGESSPSESSVSIPREKTRKTTFSISPQNSEEENDLVFQRSNNSTQKLGGDFQKTVPDSPPKEIILTHGVRRDMDLHRVRSFIINRDTDPAKYGEFVMAARNRSFSAMTTTDYHAATQDYYDDSEKNNALTIAAKKSEIFQEASLVKSRLVLYIQMELCQTSLKHWLSLRNKNIFLGKENFREGTSLLIMKQIASALLFIHSKGLIHRDLKPPNIFLNKFERPHVLLGDFGLAKSDKHNSNLTSARRSLNRSLRRMDSHTSGVGTTTYAAPEQLTAETYDAKVDVYSFGIVIYELWMPFGTAMERARQMKQLREHIIPSDFVIKHPRVGTLVSSLLDHDPKLRPNAADIFQGDFFEKSKDKIIEEQAERIQALEKETRELKFLNKKMQRLLIAKLPPA